VNKPRTGDKYRWHGIIITVGDIDPNGRWAMIHCVIPEHVSGCLTYGKHEWDKEQPTPGGAFPDWELIEAASGPEPAQEPIPPTGALRAWAGE
jgi:hypothetical protein